MKTRTYTEPFTNSTVSAKQRKHYLFTHEWMGGAFVYVGNGRYNMSAWESQILACLAL